MTKLGTCTITVEPHIFEASMFAIKDTTTKPAPTPITQQPMYRPIIQYGPPGGMMPPPGPPTPQVQDKPNPPPQSIQQPKPASQDTIMEDSKAPLPATTNNSATTQTLNGANGLAHPQTKTQASAPPNPPPPATTTRSTDPVIQMLAERAATDPTLKALMRIVANGQATPDELKRFQKHIDELTFLQKARQQNADHAAAGERVNQTDRSSQVPTSSYGPVNNSQHNGNLAPSPASAIKASPKANQYQAPPQPQALRSKGPLPPTKPDISGVVFEFTGGSGDRFLFPRFSILEYLPQGQVIASFLIVRKGSNSDSPSYDPTLDYYQPITIRLYAHQGRQLEALQKVVAPQEEVRRYMDDIMDNMTRAEYVLLAMRLPKDAEPASEEKVGDTGNNNNMTGPILWATPGQLTPAPLSHTKPTKKVLTEGEQYQNFITTVSEKPVY